MQAKDIQYPKGGRPSKGSIQTIQLDGLTDLNPPDDILEGDSIREPFFHLDILQQWTPTEWTRVGWWVAGHEAW